MQHLEEGTIHAWLDGALPPDEAALAESHVAGCAACAALVAEARGLVAASSRILTKLDEVPGDVVPITSAPSRRVARRRAWNAWPVRVAAGLLLMAGGAAVLTTNRTVWSPDAAVELKSEAASVMDSAPVAPAPPAVARHAVPAPNVRPAAPADARDLEASETAARFSAPAAIGAAAGRVTGGATVAEGAGADAASQQRQAREAREERAANDGARQGAILPVPTAVTAAPQAAAEALTLSSSTTNAARHDSLAPAARVVSGWRLVSTSPVALEAAIVRRSVYEVRPGVTVTLDESAAVPVAEGQSAVSALAARTRRAVAAAAPPAAKAAPPAAPLAQRADQSLVSEGASALAPPAGMNVLRWHSASGTVMTLWGAVGVVELEELKGRLD